MMRQKPQKRLVSKGRYILVQGVRISLYSPVLIILGAAVLLFVFEIKYKGLVSSPLWPYLRWLTGPYGEIATLTLIFCFPTLVAGLCLSALKKARSIEPVELITTHNTHLLPPEESLVRASGAPASQQQAELLRAAQYGNETPAEELLRASTTGGEGVSS